MNKNNFVDILFALSWLVAVPLFVHALNKGAYQPEGMGTFWIGPISTTVPYVFLALLFIVHSALSRRPAYCGAGVAWLSMMAFTLFLIFQTPGSDKSSTIGIAVALTPLFYFPLFIVPYVAGTTAGVLWEKRENKILREIPSPFR